VYTDLEKGYTDWKNVYTDLEKGYTDWENVYTDLEKGYTDWESVYTDSGCEYTDCQPWRTVATSVVRYALRVEPVSRQRFTPNVKEKCE
jgi:hypothetical protein